MNKSKNEVNNLRPADDRAVENTSNWEKAEKVNSGRMEGSTAAMAAEDRKWTTELHQLSRPLSVS